MVNADWGGQRRRRGCFGGCLSGLLTFVVVLVFAGVLYLAVVGLLMPWGFYLGGHFHWLPQWQAVARMHSNVAGGDYILYIELWPSTRGSRSAYPASHLTGTAWLCTPKGERIFMTMGGSMRNGIGTDLNGEKIHLYLHRKQTGFLGTQSYNPHVDIYGKWDGGQIVGDDHQSIGFAFLPDGTVYRSGKGPRPKMEKETVPVTFREGSYGEFKAACRK